MWHGHSCFSLRDSTGRTVVIDPFDETVGYGRIRLKADALLVTHEHFDHAAVGAVQVRKLDSDLVSSTGTSVLAGGLIVTGVSSSHDDEGGQINGPNRIYVFTMGGLRFAHLGDIGQTELTPYQLRMVGRVDVLFIPVGGVVTVDAAGAKRIVDQVKPSIVFPMHYGDIRFYRLGSVNSFTGHFPPEQVERPGESRVRVKQAELPEKTTVYVLEAAPHQR